jgi:hypothetical protein|tara:strand:- start:601 stop:861 length:261 start_codon:yes stop_codon:yes gene_type:complete
LNRGENENQIEKCEWCARSFAGDWSSIDKRRFCRNSPCARESSIYITALNRVRNEINNDPEQIENCKKIFKIFTEFNKRNEILVEL